MIINWPGTVNYSEKHSMGRHHYNSSTDIAGVFGIDISLERPGHIGTGPRREKG